MAVEKKFETQLAISEQERRFNQAFTQLQCKLVELWNKGEEDEYLLTFYPEYCQVAPIARTLAATLKKIGDEFFNKELSQENIEQFARTLIKANNAARGEFAKFRQGGKWFNDLHPIFQTLLLCCRALIGLIVGLVLSPALATGCYSRQEYFKTFFGKTASLDKLETFEDKAEEIIGSLRTIAV